MDVSIRIGSKLTREVLDSSEDSVESSEASVELRQHRAHLLSSSAPQQLGR
jgi:hypothetical protein